ncbi:hypothetical protein J437_LFUL018713, partial [Ladona fulva]
MQKPEEDKKRWNGRIAKYIVFEDKKTKSALSHPFEDFGHCANAKWMMNQDIKSNIVGEEEDINYIIITSDLEDDKVYQKGERLGRQHFLLITSEQQCCIEEIRDQIKPNSLATPLGVTTHWLGTTAIDGPAKKRWKCDRRRNKIQSMDYTGSPTGVKSLSDQIVPNLELSHIRDCILKYRECLSSAIKTENNFATEYKYGYYRKGLKPYEYVNSFWNDNIQGDSSPDLFQRLVQRTTDAVGMVKITRKGIPTVLWKKLKKGEVVSAKCGKLVALKWRDKRDVSMLTTRHSIGMQP